MLLLIRAWLNVDYVCDLQQYDNTNDIPKEEHSVSMVRSASSLTRTCT